MRKHLLTLFAVVCVPMLAWAADRPLTLSGGSGTESDPYLIATPADMVELADACNTPEGTATNGTTASHYAGIHFLVGADIDLSSTSEFRGIAVAPANLAPGTTWKFQGVFDGGGHTISGMALHGITFDANGKAQTAGANRSRSYIGLFGYLEGATVKNLVLASDCHVDGYAYVGSLAGSIDKGTTIENCVSYATVDGYDSSVGGLIGRANAAKATPTTIRNCMFDGSVRCCNNSVGGIVGTSSNQYVTISGCLNMASVSAYSFNSIKAEGVQYNAGGIAGAFTGQMDNCLNFGAVRATKEKAGGLAGTFSGASNVISSSLSLAPVESPAPATTGVICGSSTGKYQNCYTDASMWGTVVAGAKSPEGIMAIRDDMLTKGKAPDGLDAQTWIFENGYYPMLKVWDSARLRRAASTYLCFAEGEGALELNTKATRSPLMPAASIKIEDGEEFLSVEGASLIVTDNLPAISQGKVLLENGDFSVDVPIVALPVFFLGSGTEADPYIIDSPKALKGLGELCNGVLRKHFEGEYFRQTSDIDLGGDSGFIGIAVTTSYATAANMLIYFCGNYDGGGHTISGICIDGVRFDDDGKLQSMQSFASAGLFGAVRDGAEIRNINLDGSCVICGYNAVGSIAGEMGESVLIADCTSGASLKSYGGKIGGIVGNTTAASSSAALTESSVERCVFYGSVDCGSNYIGGIVGNNLATITDCVSGGMINVVPLVEGAALSSPAYVGGVAGYNGGSIRRGMNFATIVSPNDCTGGIAGQNAGAAAKPGAIVQCLNAAQIIGQTNPAAVVGFDNIGSTASTDRSPNWFDDVYCNYPALGRTSGSGTHVSATALATAELTAATLVDGMEGYSVAKGRYPVPEALASNTHALAVASTYMDLPEGESLSNFSRGVLPEGVTVEFPDGEGAFYVEDGMLLAHGVEELTTEAVTLVNGSYRRNLTLTALPGILPGNGTEREPYRIASAQDFATLAGAIAESGFDYVGRYFELTSDIDFTDMALVPVGTDSRPFNGIFDGKGFTVRNISHPAPVDMMQRNIAIFGNVGPKGIVRNLKLASSDIRSNLNTGGIVALLSGRVEDCSVADDCLVYSTPSDADTSNPKVFTGDFAGGVAARAEASAVILRCTNYGKIVAEHVAGGILGGTSNIPGVLVEDCVNYGEIGGVAQPTELLSGHAMAGGIVGRLCGTVSRCENNGRVVATSMNTAGGIVGMTLASASVKDCTNNGLVEVLWLNGGGIVGNTDDSSSEEAPVIISGCANHGALNIMSAAGGILGHTAGGYVEIRDSRNTADIVNRDGAGAGGIVGQSEGKTLIYGCFNTGYIEANRGAAGIAGEGIMPGLSVTRCFNAGNVRVVVANQIQKARAAAGIANSYYDSSLDVSDCYNMGTVTADEIAGGIIGQPVGATVSNCYNLGKINASQQVANISPYADNLVISNCYISDACPMFVSDGDVPRLDDTGLMDAPLGDSYVYTKACLPRLECLDLVPEAVIGAARYLLADGETVGTVKSPVVLAEVESLEWTAEGFARIEGTEAKPTGLGQFTLRASVGDLSQEYVFNSVYDPDKVGLDSIQALGGEVIGWLDMSGRAIEEPRRGVVAIAVVRGPSGALSFRKVAIAE